MLFWQLNWKKILDRSLTGLYEVRVVKKESRGLDELKMRPPRSSEQLITTAVTVSTGAEWRWSGIQGCHSVHGCRMEAIRDSTAVTVSTGAEWRRSGTPRLSQCLRVPSGGDQGLHGCHSVYGCRVEVIRDSTAVTVSTGAEWRRSGTPWLSQCLWVPSGGDQGLHGCHSVYGCRVEAIRDSTAVTVSTGAESRWSGTPRLSQCLRVPSGGDQGLHGCHSVYGCRVEVIRNSIWYSTGSERSWFGTPDIPSQCSCNWLGIGWVKNLEGVKDERNLPWILNTSRHTEYIPLSSRNQKMRLWQVSGNPGVPSPAAFLCMSSGTWKNAVVLGGLSVT